MYWLRCSDGRFPNSKSKISIFARNRNLDFFRDLCSIFFQRLGSSWPTALPPLTPFPPVCLRHCARVTVAARCSPSAVLLWMHRLIWHTTWRPHTNRNRTVHASDCPMFWCVPILPISDLRIGLTLFDVYISCFLKKSQRQLLEAMHAVLCQGHSWCAVFFWKNMVTSPCISICICVGLIGASKYKWCHGMFWKSQRISRSQKIVNRVIYCRWWRYCLHISVHLLVSHCESSSYTVPE